MASADAVPAKAESQDAPEGFDLGAELMERMPLLSTPPTLGALAGLKDMAQSLPAVDRLMQAMATNPASPALPQHIVESSQFAARLPGVAGLPTAAGLAAEGEILMHPGGASQLTDVLPPLGALPGQAAGLSGSAPLAEVHPGQPRPAPVVAKTEAHSADWEPARLLALIGQAPVTAIRQVLPAELTLTGNVLPATSEMPAQERMTPAADRELALPAPAGDERLTGAQRDAIESQRGQGQPLEGGARRRLEQSLGQSLAEVRVHTGAAASSLTSSLNALAFASGTDVFFSAGAYAPQTPAGLGLIAHELAHVIQQQYGLPGDPDVLRPASDSYERQADLVVAQAVQPPEYDAPASGPQPLPVGPLQRSTPGQSVRPLPVSDLPAPAATTTGQEIIRPPVQRFGLGQLTSLTRDLPTDLPAVPADLPGIRPALDNLPAQVSGLTDQLPNPGGMLDNLSDVTGNLPDLGQLTAGLGSLSDALYGLQSAGDRASLGSLPLLQSLPSLEGLASPPGLLSAGQSLGLGGLPGQDALSSIDDLPSRGGLADQLPALGGLAGSLPPLGGLSEALGSGLPEMPSFGGLVHDLGRALPEMPSVGGVPPLGGLRLPEMPLPSLGNLSQPAGGALEAAQGALGSITSMAPAMPEPPAAPQLPNMEKLADQIWKQVQHRLRVERERSRGLA
jgi:hypothetical protein